MWLADPPEPVEKILGRSFFICVVRYIDKFDAYLKILDCELEWKEDFGEFWKFIFPQISE